jgi:hypothetical protein
VGQQPQQILSRSLHEALRYHGESPHVFLKRRGFTREVDVLLVVKCPAASQT